MNPAAHLTEALIRDYLMGPYFYEVHQQRISLSDESGHLLYILGENEHQIPEELEIIRRRFKRAVEEQFTQDYGYHVLNPDNGLSLLAINSIGDTIHIHEADRHIHIHLFLSGQY